MMEEQDSGDFRSEAWRGNLAAYMSDKGVTGTCPACQQDSGWSRYWSKNGEVSIPVMTPTGDPFIVGGGAIATIAIGCKNCGYIMFFDLKKFKQWEKENDRLPE